MGEIIKLRCEDCDGTMMIDSNREVISCPYCGSKKIILDSDEVKIEKIRAARELNVLDKQTEREIKILDKQIEREKNIHKHNTVKSVIKYYFLLAFIALPVCVIFLYIMFKFFQYLH